MYVQIKYGLKTPHQLEEEEAQFICREGAVPLPPHPTPTHTATLEELSSHFGHRQRGPDEIFLISVQIYMI